MYLYELHYFYAICIILMAFIFSLWHGVYDIYLIIITTSFYYICSVQNSTADALDAPLHAILCPGPQRRLAMMGALYVYIY